MFHEGRVEKFWHWLEKLKLNPLFPLVGNTCLAKCDIVIEKHIQCQDHDGINQF